MDERNTHEEGDPRGFFPFGDGMRTILYLIFYSGKRLGQFFYLTSYSEKG